MKIQAPLFWEVRHLRTIWNPTSTQPFLQTILLKKTSTMQPNNLLVTLSRFHQYFLPLKKMANGCTNLQELVKKSRSHPEKLPFQHLTLQVLKEIGRAHV